MNGLFFATRKNDKQRMILDARPANWYFREPPTTTNASGSSFASLRVPEDKEFYIANYDVKDFFYRVGIDEELGKWFELPAFSHKAFVKLFGVDPTPELHPRYSFCAPVFHCSSYGIFLAVLSCFFLSGQLY